MNPSAPDNPSADDLTSEQWARRGTFVRLLVTATWILFIAMVALLYYRWVTVNEPSSVAVISAGIELAGASVIVADVHSNATFESTVDPVYGIARFFLGPGRYSLRIYHGPDKQLLYESEFYMLSNRALKFDLAGKLLPATQPAEK